jgi:hypothetical protein
MSERIYNEDYFEEVSVVEVEGLDEELELNGHRDPPTKKIEELIVPAPTNPMAVARTFLDQH